MAASRLASLLAHPHLIDAIVPAPPDLARRLADRLRAGGLDSDLAAEIGLQSELRWAGRAKYGPAATRMLYTRNGLEQGTRLAVAAHHARRFREAGCTSVADLGCGLGVDSLALAGLGLRVIAIERDPDTAACARHNLAAFPEVSVLEADVTAIDIEALGAEGYFADPARREGSTRLSHPNQWSPPLDTVLSWSRLGPLGVKLAPGIAYEMLPADSETQWVSVDGEVVEATVWCGDLAAQPARSALVIRGDRAHAWTIEGDPSAPPLLADPAADLGEYLFEPDGALIRAGGVAHLAERLHAHPVYPRVAYLTGDAPLPASCAAFAKAWRILDVVSLKTKKLKAAMRAWDAGAVTIKKRGVDVSPENLRRRIVYPKGEQAVTLICTRVGSRHVALRVEEVPPATA